MQLIISPKFILILVCKYFFGVVKLKHLLCVLKILTMNINSDELAKKARLYFDNHYDVESKRESDLRRQVSLLLERIFMCHSIDEKEKVLEELVVLNKQYTLSILCNCYTPSEYQTWVSVDKAIEQLKK